jgi:hypothetical protein
MSLANGASRRSGERESVQGSPRGEAPRLEMSQSETERAKHPAKVLTVTVDAVLDHPSAVILHSAPDSLIRPPGDDPGGLTPDSSA